MTKKISFLLLVFYIISCRKDAPDSPSTTPPPVSIPQGKGVFIANEGNFQGGNATVSYYKFSDSSVVEDLFKPKNGRPLGDVCQSITLLGKKAYIVVNNSGTIEIVDPETFLSSGTVTGLISPRYLLAVDSNKAYVSDFKSNKISVVDLNSRAVTKTISCSGWTEGMAYLDHKVYVSNLRHSAVYIINTNTDAIDDSIKVGYASSGIKVDKHNKLWVLCEGDQNLKIAGSLYRINPSTKAVEFSQTFGSGSPDRLALNGTLDTLYFLNQGVYQMPIAAGQLPMSPVIPANGATFYGLGIEPHSGEIYVSDAVHYVERGFVYVYNPKNYKRLHSFKAGIIPSEFCFY